MEGSTRSSGGAGRVIGWSVRMFHTVIKSMISQNWGALISDSQESLTISAPMDLFCCK